MAFGMVEAVRRPDVPPDRTHDPGRHRPIEPERIADRICGVPHPDRSGVPEHERMECRRWGRDANDGDVAGGVDADDLRRVRASAGEPDPDTACARHDVVVRDDVAAVVDHEAGAEGADPLLLGRGEGGRRDDVRLRVGDDDDARGVLAVDLARRERLGRRRARSRTRQSWSRPGATSSQGSSRFRRGARRSPLPRRRPRGPPRAGRGASGRAAVAERVGVMDRSSTRTASVVIGCPAPRERRADRACGGRLPRHADRPVGG